MAEKDIKDVKEKQEPPQYRNSKELVIALSNSAINPPDSRIVEFSPLPKYQAYAYARAKVLERGADMTRDPRAEPLTTVFWTEYCRALRGQNFALANLAANLSVGGLAGDDSNEAPKFSQRM